MAEPTAGSIVRGARSLDNVLAQIGAEPGCLGAIVDAAPEALIAFTAERAILHANRSAEVLFGHPRSALVGKSTDDLLPPRMRQPNAPAMQPIADPLRIELPGLRADGSELTVEWRLGSTTVGDRPVFVMEVRDHAAILRAAEALRASEERFRLLVDGVRDYAIYFLDTAGCVSAWNRGAERGTGWRADEIVGRSYAALFTAEDREAGAPALQLARALAEGTLEVTGWRERRDGTRHRARASLAVLRTDAGDHYGFAQITRDLTDRVHAEQTERSLEVERAGRASAEAAERRLRESEERLRAIQAITAQLSEAVTPNEVAGVILERSLGMFGAIVARLYVMRPEDGGLDLLDQRGDATHARLYLHVEPDARVPFADAARTRGPVFCETEAAVSAAYPEVCVGRVGALAVLPLVAHGELLGVFGLRFAEARAFEADARTLLATVSELCAQALTRARAYAAQAAARAAAEAANRSKDEFLAMLGHELRNPLAPIVTALGLLDRQATEATRRERAVIDRHIKHLVRLVDDLLDVSRITQKKVELRYERVELAEVVERARDLSSPLVAEREHHLAIDVPATGLCVFGDATRLAQIVTNLLTNAAKYTPRGGHISVVARREGESAVVDVRDDGQGIAKEMMPHIFDLFAQESQAIDRARGGLGLGLAIVKSLVAMHHGSIVATSVGHGAGSTFTLRLPLAGEQVSVPVPARAPTPLRTSGPRKILVVDDNVDAAELMADLLRSDGHDVVTAHDGRAAIAALGAFPADVALLDIGLPELDGYAVARHVRGSNGSIRLVAVTGYGQADDRERARAAGFDHHVVKPVDLATLRKLVAAR